MTLSYKRLFKLLIDLNLKKKELCSLAGISSTSVSKLRKGQNINTEIIDKICSALNCKIEDIVEFTKEEK